MALGAAKGARDRDRRGAKAGAWRSAVAALVMGLSGVSSASAEDWWSVAVNAEGIQVSSDAASLSCSGDRCSIWEFTRYTLPKPDGIQSLRDLAEYDCDAHRTRTRLEIKYGADGRPRQTVNVDGDPWKPVEAGSVGGDTLAFACNFQQDARGDSEAGVLNISGQTFVRLTPSDPRNPGVTPPVAPRRRMAAVQIAAASSLGGARLALDTFSRGRQSTPVNLSTRIERSRDKLGRRVFRALIVGFASMADAEAFCARRKTLRSDCFTRWKWAGAG